MQPNHPFLDGVVGELQQNKWASKSSKKDEFKWWLENRSYPIQIIDFNSVHVLISSWEIKNKWGEAPVLVYFDYGKRGGRVIHMISHTHLQKGGVKGKYASALILTNILDEKISVKMGIQKEPTPGYVSNWGDYQKASQQGNQPPLEEQWVTPSTKKTDYVTPNNLEDASNVGLTTTSQIVQVQVNDPKFSYATKCAYCGYDFGEYTKKIYKCKECEIPYHEDCINQQVNEGICKNCGRILLW
jgi:hypothetical protein